MTFTLPPHIVSALCLKLICQTFSLVAFFAEHCCCCQPVEKGSNRFSEKQRTNQALHAHSISKVGVHVNPVVENWGYILRFGGTLKIKNISVPLV